MKKLTAIFALLFCLDSFALTTEEARKQAMDFGGGFSNSASMVVNEQNKISTPGYTTDNPDQTKYFNGGNAEEASQEMLKNSDEGKFMSQSLPKRPQVVISPNDSFLNTSKAIENNPNEVIAMLTGTYAECKPITYSRIEHEIRTCDEYDEPDCMDGDKILSVSGAETTFNYPTIETSLSWRGGGGCSKYYSTTDININKLSAIEGFVLQSVEWDDVIQIKLNGKIIFENGNINSGRCERSTIFGVSPNVDLKPYLIEGNNKIELALGVSGMGFATARYVVNYPKDKKCYHVNNCKNVPDNCTLQESKCLNLSKENICKYNQNIYQCSSTQVTAIANVQCGSNTYCVNGQCDKIENESNNDFAKSIAYLSAINQAGKEQGNSADKLKIFTGTASSCSKTTTLGWNSCCKDEGWGQDFGASCSEDEKRLIELQSKKLCHYVGSYCSDKTFYGSCKKVTKTYCCFNSKISRVIVEQGRAQLGIDWGAAESPECRGFTTDELQKMRFDKMDMSEISADIASSVVVPDKAFLEGKVKQTVGQYGQTN